MSKPTQALPVKLVFSVFAPATGILNDTINGLSALYGQPDFVSEQIPFDYTDYYSPEMGEKLVRRFLSMEKLIRPEALPDIKHTANSIEDKFTVNERRLVNIDPGYICQAHLILATGKGYSHRPYLRDGVYADLTLIYQDKKFSSLPWTYPDYAAGDQLLMFDKIRARYLLQLRQQAKK